MMRFKFRSKGVALFISVLMTMSLSIIALATIARLSELSHTTGKDLQDRRLLTYAYSAVNIVNGELRQLIDSTFECEDAYSINGGLENATTNDGTFKYYPRDISTNPGSGFEPRFAYRAVARRITTDKNALLYGLNTAVGSGTSGTYAKDKAACYDVTVDVREVIDLGTNTNNIKMDLASQTEGTNGRYSLGKMKTIGLISCFTRGENKNN
ncbi:MAG: hypothetical protein J5647_08135 [Spirochaetaceae bacterium]|nr:hypothetical protein [Spirochaetaceae bacterium]